MLQRGTVALVIPVLNEEAYIGACLTSLLASGPATLQSARVLVMDGGSTDGTAAVVARLAEGDPRIALVANPKRRQSAALNLAARSLPPEVRVLLRADAHATYPPGWADCCLAALEDTGATSVVVPMRTVGVSGFQRGVAAAQNSRLGTGGSAHRGAGRSGWVEHGHHAAFDRAFFRSIGGYDEGFTHNEDAELDVRGHLAGGRVWMCAEAPVDYFPRAAPGALARQYFRHGAGRARTVLRHGLRPRLRQMLPVAALLGCVGALVLAPVLPALLAVPLLYALLCLGWAAALAAHAGDPWVLAAGPAAMIMHLSWGAGFLWSALRREKAPGPAAVALKPL